MRSFNPYAAPIDNLSAFTHPIFQQKFRYMNSQEGLALAQTILDEFIKSGYQNIVVIESGTSPLVQTMKKLRAFRASGISIWQLKIPRDTDFNLLGWFETYLTDEELAAKVVVNGASMSRRRALKLECSKNILPELVGAGEYNVYDSINDEREYDHTLTQNLRRILRGTALSEVFRGRFLLFDEYINSGTVLRNFNAMARLFTSRPYFQVSAFCIFVDNSDKYPKIAFSLYDKRTELECYTQGAYPYENRIDLIGYYYLVTTKQFLKITLDEARAEIRERSTANSEEFYRRLLTEIDDSGLETALKSALAEDQVRNYVTSLDIARCLMRQLEYAANGETKYWGLLDQAFELYAPAWSPMPVVNHLDYWNGFMAVSVEMELLVQKLLPMYRQFRATLLDDILGRFISRKKEWNDEINKLIKEGQI
jgi:hypothetical protein